MNPGLALGLSLALAAVGYFAGWLTRAAVPVAAVTGGAILWGAGVGAGMLLALFFFSGSLLTYRTASRAGPGRQPADRGRTVRQVVANGAWAAVGALLVPVASAPGWAILVGALASAQADTWATEIGSRSSGTTRLITTGAPVSPGTSGGVTLPGTAGGLAGALLLAGLAVLVGAPPACGAAGLAGGAVGMTLDSWLGATVQGRFQCPACGAATEQARHDCGGTAQPVGGWRWLDNDVVNLVANGGGAAVAWLLVSWS